MKRLFLLLAFAASTTSVQAAVTAPNVSIQSGGVVSVVWRAPATETAKVAVFIPGNATAINALYRVYPNGKQVNSTACLSTDATYPCFKIAVNQALHKNSWVQLTVNNDVNTQWAFVKNVGSVTVASNNLGATEKLGVAGMNFISGLNTQQISAKWAKAISTLTTARKAISRCLNDNAGDATMCDDVTQPEKLQKYGITALPAGTGSSDGAYWVDPYADWVSMTMGQSGDGDAGIVIQGDTPLAKCKMSLVPEIDKAAGVIKWVVFAESTDIGIADDFRCTTFVKGAVAGAPNYSGYGKWYSKYDNDRLVRAKWARALTAVTSARQAINRCLNDNQGDKTMCDDVTQPGLELQKYGITALPAGTGSSAGNPAPASDPYADWVSMNINQSADHGDAGIVILGGRLLAGCMMSLVPEIDKAAGVIKWRVFAEATDYVLADEARCMTFVKGAIPGAPVEGYGSYGKWYNKYNSDSLVRARWRKALTTLSAVKQAIKHCLQDNLGNKTECDSVTTEADKLQKYGITSLPAGTGSSDGSPTSDPYASWEYMIMGISGAADAAIVIQGGTSLARCKITLQPTFDLGAKYVKWSLFAESTDFGLADEAKCATFVKSAIAGAPI